tara:strand:+ start:1163 stop:1594 length:432 start_codon:yes stop_codon:yes gene_type:complete
VENHNYALQGGVGLRNLWRQCSKTDPGRLPMFRRSGARTGLALSLLLTAGAALGGCAQIEVITPEPSHAGPPSETQRVYSGWFGLSSGYLEAEDCEITDAMTHVRANVRPDGAFVAILTFGAIVPFDVEYRCAQPDPGPGTLE